MNLRNEIRHLAAVLDAEDNAASDLWSWLPSHRAAVMCHGDYASEFTPSSTDVMVEATMYLSFLRDRVMDHAQTTDWFECPCGECEGPKRCQPCDFFIGKDSTGKCRALEDAPLCDEGKPHAKCPFIRGNGGLLERVG
jgi:hypothetical protein